MGVGVQRLSGAFHAASWAFEMGGEAGRIRTLARHPPGRTREPPRVAPLSDNPTRTLTLALLCAPRHPQRRLPRKDPRGGLCAGPGPCATLPQSGAVEAPSSRGAITRPQSSSFRRGRRDLCGEHGVNRGSLARQAQATAPRMPPGLPAVQVATRRIAITRASATRPAPYCRSPGDLLRHWLSGLCATILVTPTFGPTKYCIVVSSNPARRSSQ